ncbi:phage holin family protein [Arundinibacter roseus]|uniref:Phage holin family protein n=1 Tax=Arundinibacter roseus TaxID=2070510 RepID=A0A4V2XAV3_9BACT|nr:phage holin family protein [Arundinibacter roseus]TDB69045.1 hypothetical protein EZE20_01545 [Arundinibacter roseus]
MFRQIEEIRETLFKYLETRIELFQIETRDRIEQLIITLLFFLIGASFLIVVLILSILLLVALLNQWLDSRYAGYLIMIGFFAALAGIWFVKRTAVLLFLRRIITKAMQEKAGTEL